MYKLKDEYLYMFVKRGNSVLAPGKNRWLSVMDGMVYNYIDTRDWEAPEGQHIRHPV